MFGFYGISTLVGHLMPNPVNAYILNGAFNKFPDFFVQVFKIVVDSWKFSMLSWQQGDGQTDQFRSRSSWCSGYLDKNCRLSIERISAQFDVSVGNVHTTICEELKMRKICAKFVPRVLREDQKERHCHDSREMVELINSDPTVPDALVTCNESWIYCYDPETKTQSSQWKHASFSKKARQSKSTHKLLMIAFSDSTCMICIH